MSIDLIVSRNYSLLPTSRNRIQCIAFLMRSCLLFQRLLLFQTGLGQLSAILLIPTFSAAAAAIQMSPPFSAVERKVQA